LLVDFRRWVKELRFEIANPFHEVYSPLILPLIIGLPNSCSGLKDLNIIPLNL
jgi:hypothetical protein